MDFALIGKPRRNYSASRSARCVDNGYELISRPANCSAAYLAVVTPVVWLIEVRFIGKHQNRELKENFMFPVIAAVLSLIPLEAIIPNIHMSRLPKKPPADSTLTEYIL